MGEMEEFQELEEIIRNTPKVLPPEHLTPQVMTAIGQVQTSLYARAWNFLAERRTFSLDPARALRGQSSPDEMFIYFIMAAAAHLVFALVLLIGFRNVITQTHLPTIILLQPWVLLFLAGWLGLWGFLLKKKTAIGIKIARAIMLIYIEAAIINGVLLIIEFSSMILLIPFIVTIVGGTIAAGVFLALICGSDPVNPGHSCPNTKMMG